MGDDDTLVQPARGTNLDRKRGSSYLTVLSGQAVGTTYKLRSGETVIGRGAEADVQIVDDGVSRRHAKIVRDLDGTAKIVDLKSTNGTYVNGKRIDVEALREGDRLRIGQSTTMDFRYEYMESIEGNEGSAPEPEPSGEQRLRGGYDNLAATLDSLGKIYNASGQYDQALQAYRRTLSIRQKKFGPNHPAVASILHSIGEVLFHKRDFTEAMQFHERALEIYEAHVRGEPPPEMAHILTSLGEAHGALMEPAKARTFLNRAQELLESRDAPSSELARVRFALARVIYEQGEDPARARLLAKKARVGFEEGDKNAREHVKSVDAWLAEHR